MPFNVTKQERLMLTVIGALLVLGVLGLVLF